MDIHEYQAKELLAGFGVRIPRGGLSYSPEQAAYRAREIGGSRWVVKAQVHSGGRGKAGGIRICNDENQIYDTADALFGKRLITRQSGPVGRIIYRVYVEAGITVKRALYFGFVMDRKSERVMVVASRHGGMDIEDISASEPGSIVRSVVEPAIGMQTFQAREIAFKLGIEPAQTNEAVEAIIGCYRAFEKLDATMLEINPMAITDDGLIYALDAKMTFDDNALYRHPEIAELRDKSQEDQRETHATDRGLNYIGLDGNIGCVVNGAGLAMATMDMITEAGGVPANFLDIGGGATPEKVGKAFRLVISDTKVSAILVNIFAGINRCDWIAEGIVQALKRNPVEVPVVVRLAGTNVEEGRKILSRSGLAIIRANTLAEAADRVVRAVNSQSPLQSVVAP